MLVDKCCLGERCKLVIRMVGSMSLQEKQSEGWVSKLRQLRDGGEKDQDEIMKTPASQKKMK